MSSLENLVASAQHTQIFYSPSVPRYYKFARYRNVRIQTIKLLVRRQEVLRQVNAEIDLEIEIAGCPCSVDPA